MKTADLRFRELEGARAGQRILAIHYACESFYEAKDHPPAVACITLVDFVSGGDMTFALTDSSTKDETKLLERYFDCLKQHSDVSLVHWNMNSSDFGFSALEKRLHFLDPNAAVHQHPASRLYDLDDLITARHGRGYADHPKLQSLGRLNDFPFRHFRTGKEEAELFKGADVGTLKRSTVEKAWLIAFLSQRLLDGTLETNNGGRFVPFASAAIDSIQIVLSLGQRFRDVERQLKRRHAGRNTLLVNDEYDAQDLMHALLRVFFSDVRKEEWTPSYAGGSSRIDFLVPEYKLAIELKHGRPSMKKADVGAQLAVDVERYHKHPDVKHLVCLVFDFEGTIENPREVERDLGKPSDRMSVTVRVLDR